MASKPRYKAPTPDQARIAELEKELNAWRDRAFVAEDRIKTMIPRERFKQALVEIADGSRADGWKAGVEDALIPQSLDHEKAKAYIASLYER
jgi:hypothetical protein